MKVHQIKRYSLTCMPGEGKITEEEASKFFEERGETLMGIKDYSFEDGIQIFHVETMKDVE